ncbi:MAG TPA: WD40 repeat domain-containing protein [Gemmataceae bacterium]|nr:WD40 repeat domain-containing protein [Gemmataceae bacterium]
MPESAGFADLVCRLREGAPGAVEEFLAEYGEAIRVLAHLKCLPYRYATADALAADLRRFLDGAPVLARRPGALERLGRWCRRHPGPAVALAMGSLVVATGAALLIVSLFARERARTAKEVGEVLEQVREEKEKKEEALTQVGPEQKKTAQALTEAERQRHRAEVRSATLALERGQGLCEQGDVAQGLLWMARGLEVAPPDEDDLRRVLRLNLAGWHRRLNVLEALLPHRGALIKVAFSPDGKTALTASQDMTARLWDAATGQSRGEPLHHGKPGPDLAPRQTLVTGVFSPDGKTILTGGSDNTARLWDAATGRPRGEPLPSGLVTAVAFSPDGRTLLTGGFDQAIRLWDRDTGRQLGDPLPHPGVVPTAVFSPDGRSIVSGCGRIGDDRQWHWTAHLWDVAGHKARAEPMPHDGPFEEVQFSPDSRVVLTTSTTKVGRHAVRAWSAETGRPLDLPPLHDGLVLCVAFSPDGKTALSGGYDMTAWLWDAVTWQAIGPPLQHRDPVWVVAFGPDGKTLLTPAGMAPSPGFEVRVWDAATRRPLGPPLVQRDVVNRLACSADGRLLLTARTGTDLPTRPGEVWLRELPAPADADARRVVLWVQVVTGLELGHGETVRRLEDAERRQRREELEKLAAPVVAPIDSPEAVAAWHEEEARDCEGEGRWAGAVWHLERLVGEGPGGERWAAWRDRLRAEMARHRAP